MAEHYFEVPLRTILDEYIRHRLKDSGVRRLPLTGQPIYDEWFDPQRGSVLFRIFDAAAEDGE